MRSDIYARQENTTYLQSSPRMLSQVALPLELTESLQLGLQNNDSCLDGLYRFGDLAYFLDVGDDCLGRVVVDSMATG